VTASLAQFEPSSPAAHPQVDHNGAAQAYYMATWKPFPHVPVIYICMRRKSKLTGVTTKFRATHGFNKLKQNPEIVSKKKWTLNQAFYHEDLRGMER
jgi:hypothetical protein